MLVKCHNCYYNQLVWANKFCDRVPGFAHLNHVTDGCNHTTQGTKQLQSMEEDFTSIVVKCAAAVWRGGILRSSVLIGGKSSSSPSWRSLCSEVFTVEEKKNKPL